MKEKTVEIPNKAEQVKEEKKEQVPEEAQLSKKEIRKQKATQKREKRNAKLREKLFKNDIKYQGPLSYRYLRIIAWVAFALGALSILNGVFANMGWSPLGLVWQNIFHFISSITTPLFIIASFGLVLSGRRGYRSFIISYGALFFAIGLGINFVYYRYVNGLFKALSVQDSALSELVKALAEERLQINVFADLFAFTLFHFYINYQPKKYFQGKKLLIFRLFCLIPTIYALTSYVFKIVYGLGYGDDLPFWLFPFMTTKSPLVVGVFAVISIWIKNREKLFIRIGASKEDFNAYLNTNRNSLSFSITLSIIIAIFVVLEFIFLFALIFVYSAVKGDDYSGFFDFVGVAGVGQLMPLAFAIPLIMLYSYTRDHKKSNIDLFIPIAGIGLTAFICLEFIFNFLTHLASGS